jgi:thiol-disulfide isomerase/thioredoxin
VLLNFWATWCGPCKIEIPWFVEFQNKYQDRGLAVLGVSMDEDGWQAVRPFIAAHNMNYRVPIGIVVVNAPPARTVCPCTVDEDDMFTSDCCALKFGVLDRTAAHNIVANTANRLNITTSSSFLLSSDFNRLS